MFYFVQTVHVYYFKTGMGFAYGMGYAGCSRFANHDYKHIVSCEDKHLMSLS